MRRWITRLIDWIRYGKVYQPTTWERHSEPEEHVMVTLPPLPPVQPLHFKRHGVWTQVYLREHPEIKQRRVEFFTEEDWPRIQAEDAAFALSERDTCKVTGEQTAKYKAFPWWMK